MNTQQSDLSLYVYCALLCIFGMVSFFYKNEIMQFCLTPLDVLSRFIGTQSQKIGNSKNMK